MLVIDKIMYLLEHKKCNQNDLSDYLNIPENKISEWKSGKTKSYKKYISKIAEFFNVSTDYLLNDNIPVVCNDLSLSNAEIISSNEIYSVPVYESVSAGLGRAAISEPIGYHPLYIKNPADVDNMFCVMVNGDSMYPIINDGDMIVVHRQSQVENAQIAVIYVKDKDEALVKKFYHDKNYIELVSVNPMYPPIHLEGNKMNDICIQGLVKQVIKNV